MVGSYSGGWAVQVRAACRGGLPALTVTYATLAISPDEATAMVRAFAKPHDADEVMEPVRLSAATCRALGLIPGNVLIV